MASLVAKAAKGNRKAMCRLYEQTKKDAFFLAVALAGKKSAWIDVLIDSYREMLALSTLSMFSDDESFKTALLNKVVFHAKEQVLRQNPKAFRLAERRFDVRTLPEPGANDITTVFSAFTDLQRFIFVLDTTALLSEETLVGVTKLDRRTLAQAIGMQKQNIEFILGEGAYDPFIKAFKEEQATASIPLHVAEALPGIIDEILEPVKKAHRKRTLKAVLISLGVCVFLVGFSALLIWDMTRPDETPSQSDSDTTDTTNAAHASVGTVTSVTATHYADIDIKDHGVITVALDATTAPETVTNFMMLADSGFYDGLTFHRIMKGFMMQGGDPNGNGTGGSDTNVTGEFADNGIENPLSHVRGAISMARATDYNSGSSQFFIVHEDSTFLDGQYAAFGYVTEGMDIVDTICTTASPTDNNGTIPSENQPIINTITIRSAN